MSARRAAANREGGQRLVVVSNRLPMTLRRARDGWRAERSAGGLATALGPVLERTSGIWIGWPGSKPEEEDGARAQVLARWAEKERLIAVEIPEGVVEGFYEGYANQTLWPLFHGFPARVNFDPAGWDAYVGANRLFLDALLEHVRDDDLVWIHDYQLMLLPEMLRAARPDLRIGFFLHIPFPASDVFRVLPRREEILHGLLGADLLAFQTHAHLQHFRSCLLRVTGIESRMDQVDVAGRPVRLDALPIGISPEDFAGMVERNPRVGARLGELRRRFEGRRVLLAVDRLDYTKGIPERLLSYRRLLRDAPDLHGKVVLIQVAVPTREAIPEYEGLKRDVNELVGAINGDFATPSWTPVVYLRRSISRTELLALYELADLGWVAPLKDGMNLVAKEFVACQTDGDAVLVLSEFAGAAAEMGEAFLVNPYDEDRTAAVLERALNTTLEERRDRMLALRRRVLRNNALAWSERFVDQLATAAHARADRQGDGWPIFLPVDELRGAFHRSSVRWLFLDYDGSLVPFAKRPSEAVPPVSLVQLLAELAAMPSTHVVLVSGRGRHDLEAWFGDVPGLWLAAEHAVMLRSPCERRWEEPRAPVPVEGMDRVRTVLEHFVDRTPGSFIEEKECSLVWHHRMADPEFGAWLANDLAATLDEMLAETELRAVRGKKSVEVKLAWATKGDAVTRLGSIWPAADFLLAAGDDRSDEELFERLGPEHWTVHVGAGPSRARFRLPGPEVVMSVLRSLVERP